MAPDSKHASFSSAKKAEAIHLTSTVPHPDRLIKMSGQRRIRENFKYRNEWKKWFGLLMFAWPASP